LLRGALPDVRRPAARLGLRRPVLLDADVRLLQHGSFPGYAADGWLRSRTTAIAKARGHPGWHGRRQRTEGVAEGQRAHLAVRQHARRRRNPRARLVKGGAAMSFSLCLMLACLPAADPDKPDVARLLVQLKEGDAVAQNEAARELAA